MSKNSTTNDSRPHTNSGTDGRIGFFGLAVDVSAARRTLRAWRALGELEEDEDDETDEGERLGEGDAEEHRRADHARGLGLAGHGRDGVADHDADTDTGADGGGAVADTGADGAEALQDLLGADDDVGCCEGRSPGSS